MPFSYVQMTFSAAYYISLSVVGCEEKFKLTLSYSKEFSVMSLFREFKNMETAEIKRYGECSIMTHTFPINR